MTNAATPKRVIVYAKPDGQEPFIAWLNDLQDGVAQKRILARLTRLEQGNFGDCKPVGEGVSELRMFFGSGYRVYFGEHGNDTGCSPLRRGQRQSGCRHSTGKNLLAEVPKP